MAAANGGGSGDYATLALLLTTQSFLVQLSSIFSTTHMLCLQHDDSDIINVPSHDPAMQHFHWALTFGAFFAPPYGDPALVTGPRSIKTALLCHTAAPARSSLYAISITRSSYAHCLMLFFKSIPAPHCSFFSMLLLHSLLQATRRSTILVHFLLCCTPKSL
jgi:hypothetical protein